MRNVNRITAAVLALAVGSATLTAQDRKVEVKPLTDADFVMMAASGGLFEVESSKLALAGANSPDVKKFAEKMIADHEKANRELMQAAKQANLSPPDRMLDEHQKLLERVKGAKGQDLDRTYMDTQVTAHQEAVALFTSAARNAKDPGLKAFAAKTLPVIQEHYEHVKKHATASK